MVEGKAYKYLGNFFACVQYGRTHICLHTRALPEKICIMHAEVSSLNSGIKRRLFT